MILSSAKFNTHELDQTGLSYFNARYYDSDTGRFISPDPTIPNPTDTQAYNRYMFVQGNPISFVDMDGYRLDESGTGSIPDEVTEQEEEYYDQVRDRQEQAAEDVRNDPNIDLSQSSEDNPKWNDDSNNTNNSSSGSSGNDGLGFYIEGEKDTITSYIYTPIYDVKTTDSFYGNYSLGSVKNSIGFNLLWGVSSATYSGKLTKSSKVYVNSSSITLEWATGDKFTQFFVGNEDSGRFKFGKLVGTSLTTNSAQLLQTEVYPNVSEGLKAVVASSVLSSQIQNLQSTGLGTSLTPASNVMAPLIMPTSTLNFYYPTYMNDGVMH
jgi:RHS repeat-associated protein